VSYVNPINATEQHDQNIEIVRLAGFTFNTALGIVQSDTHSFFFQLRTCLILEIILFLFYFMEIIDVSKS